MTSVWLWDPFGILLLCFGYGCLIFVDLFILFSISLVGDYIKKESLLEIELL